MLEQPHACWFGERKPKFCIVLLQWSSGLAGQNWLWWEQELSALVSHPAFLSPSLSVHTHSQTSMETQGELNGSELPGQKWHNIGQQPHG